ncbi:MAG: DUF6036 family nucleotidyltransferase [Myxococcota bacterium]
MRELADAERICRFMRELGLVAKHEGRVYLTGGTTAVLKGWRSSTVDVDLKLVPDQDELLRAIPRLKESLKLNVELAAPDQFIPALPGWEERSPFIAREGRLFFHHYDLYAQALSKIERGHAKDAEDVEALLRLGLIERTKLLELYEAIEPLLYRYPSLDPKSFRRAVERIVAGS